MKITEEGYNYALFMTRGQGLQRETVGFFLSAFVFSGLFFFPLGSPNQKFKDRYQACPS